jgi:hypothetical protein
VLNCNRARAVTDASRGLYREQSQSAWGSVTGVLQRLAKQPGLHRESAELAVVGRTPADCENQTIYASL